MYSFICYTIAFILLLKCFVKLIYRPCTSKVCLVGKTAIVTGGSKGLGYETTLGLAARGCKVIIACRSNADQVVAEITKTTNNPNISAKYLDLSSLASVRKFCKEIHETEEKIDILIHNAGEILLEKLSTEDGFNPIMQINVFGPFLLTHLLTDLLKKAENARIVFVSSIISILHGLTLNNLNASAGVPSTPSEKWTNYANSRAGQIIISNEFADRLKPFGITSNALHPGVANTGILDRLITSKLVPSYWRWIMFIIAYPYMRTPEEIVQRTLTVATSDDYKTKTGTFLWHLPIVAKCTKDKEFRRKIWTQIEDLVKLTEGEKI